MIAQINSNTVTIGSTVVKFKYQISKTITLTNGDLLILLNIPTDSSEKNNLYCYTAQGQLKWRIQPSELEKQGKLCFAYEGINQINDDYFVVDFYGRRFFFDPSTGVIIKQDIVK